MSGPFCNCSCQDHTCYCDKGNCNKCIKCKTGPRAMFAARQDTCLDHNLTFSLGTKCPMCSDHSTN